MNKALLIVGLITITSLPALADTPGNTGNQGPDGCERHAVVLDDFGSYAEIKLGAKTGSCREEPTGCGHEDDLLKVELPPPVPDTVTFHPAVGSEVTVWVRPDGKSASLTHPGCK